MKILQTMAAVALSAATMLSACSGKSQKAESAEDANTDSKAVVCYFSATGTTKAAAERLAKAIGADLYEIAPETPYTDADLDWRDSTSRSSVEMHDATSRPALADKAPDLAKYDIVYIGYPNWWNDAPTIINTFIEAAKLDGKTVAPFMTSGGSDIVNSEEHLHATYPGINWKPGLLMNSVSDEDIKAWTEKVSR